MPSDAEVLLRPRGGSVAKLRQKFVDTSSELETIIQKMEELAKNEASEGKDVEFQKR